MKKKFSFILVLSLALSVFLAACGSSDEKESGDNGSSDDKKILIGASNVPHAEILEQAAPLLEKEGIDLEIKTYTDYIIPNKALANGELDANYFQHIPYLEAQVAENDYDIVSAGGIHIEPIGVYSKKYDSLDQLPEGAEIIMSSSVPDHGRILTMLEAEGLITLKDGVDKTTATVADIKDNPKKLTFKTDVEAAMLPKIYANEDVDAVLINSNYAIDAGLDPVKDSIALEDSDSPYVNIIAVQSGDEDSEKIKKLVEVLHSEEIQEFIKEEYNGAVVPVTE
ncbi:MAG: MetQ/NlpA family ABC transporter substrate-binding protein [Bacillus sp. (in: firmicutes)]